MISSMSLRLPTYNQIDTIVAFIGQSIQHIQARGFRHDRIIILLPHQYDRALKDYMYEQTYKDCNAHTTPAGLFSLCGIPVQYTSPDNTCYVYVAEWPMFAALS